MTLYGEPNLPHQKVLFPKRIFFIFKVAIQIYFFYFKAFVSLAPIFCLICYLGSDRDKV